MSECTCVLVCVYAEGIVSKHKRVCTCALVKQSCMSTCSCAYAYMYSYSQFMADEG